MSPDPRDLRIAALQRELRDEIRRGVAGRSEVARLQRVLKDRFLSDGGLAVLETSVGAYRQLSGMGQDTLTYFYEHAHPSVRAWALATLAYIETKGDPRGRE